MKQHYILSSINFLYEEQFFFIGKVWFELYVGVFDLNEPQSNIPDSFHHRPHNTKYHDLKSRDGVRQKYCWGDTQLPIMLSLYALHEKIRSYVVFLSVLCNLS